MFKGADSCKISPVKTPRLSLDRALRTIALSAVTTLLLAACPGVDDTETDTVKPAASRGRPAEAMKLPLIERLEAYRPFAIHRDDAGTIYKLSLVDEQLTRADLETVAGFLDLEILLLGGTMVGDEELKLLSPLTRLRILGLRNTTVTNKGLSFLEPLQNLESLLLGGTKVTDHGLSTLVKFPELRTVALGRNEIHGEGLKALIQLHYLDHLILSVTSIDDEDLAVVARIPTLRKLFLAKTAVGDIGVRHLLSLDRLESLELYETAVTDKVVGILLEMPSLTSVDLRGTVLSEEAITRLSEGNPDLSVVSGPSEEQKHAEETESKTP